MASSAAPAPAPGGGAPAPAPSGGAQARAPGPAPGPATGGPTTGSGAPAPAPSGTKKKTEKKKKATKSDAGTTKTKKTPAARRKKPSTKASGSAASNQALTQAAKAAQSDLAKSKAQAAAKKTDPLWYRIEDVLPLSTSKTEYDTAMAPGGVLPEQVKIVEAALAHNNMTRSDVTPQAMACLLEQARRYAQELIEDAQDYAAHGANMFVATPTGKTLPPQHGAPPEPSAADYRLAAEMRPDHPKSVTSQLPKLNLLAQQVNGAPLPPIPTQCYSGVLLPPQPHSLTARTFDVVSGAHVAQKMIQNAPTAPKAFSSNLAATKSKSSKGSSSKPGYGASRGAQIPIQLKSKGSSSAESPQQQPPKPHHDATPKPQALSKPNAPSSSVPAHSKTDKK